MALAIAYIVVAVVVLAVAFSCPGSKKTASSTTTTGTGAATMTSTTGAPTNATLTYSAELTGDAEIPAVSTSATGTLTLTVAFDGSSVDYVLRVSKITDVTVARLHEGKVGATGETIITLFDGPAKTGVFSGTLAQGSFTAADLEGPLKGKTIEDLVTLIIAGSVNLNVGTSSHRAGEIRGQVK